MIDLSQEKTGVGDALRRLKNTRQVLTVCFTYDREKRRREKPETKEILSKKFMERGKTADVSRSSAECFHSTTDTTEKREPKRGNALFVGTGAHADDTAIVSHLFTTCERGISKR